MWRMERYAANRLPGRWACRCVHEIGHQPASGNCFGLVSGRMELPDPHALVTLLTAVVAFYLYTRSWMRVEMVSVLLLLALLVIFHFFPFVSRDARLTEVEVLGSFGHPALVAICCLMILARGLTVTGALEPLVRLLARLWGVNATLGLLVSIVVGGAARAFVNDTPPT